MGIYEEKLEELKALCESFKDFDGYKLNREKFNEFSVNGVRLNYENEYFARRGCLMARAVNVIINKSTDADLIKIINAVCDEFTWALPAHIGENTKTPDKVIDLFSAETAQTLAEITHYVKLPKPVNARILSLVYDRIIEPFENNVFWWENSPHNWAAVCSGSVGMTYIYLFPERFSAVKERLINALNCFLSGYGDDGACLEGLGYWGYGFGYFIYFAELLKSFDGTDLLASDKALRIAEFSQNMFLKNGAAVSFSDSFREGTFNIGLACFLKREYGKSIEIPDISSRADYDECYRFAGYLRSFLWLDEELLNGSGEVLGEKYFEDAQWYVNRQELFAFAAKGGCNGEPHNHNDIGSFIIADRAGQLIADFGSGEYTRDYFNDEKRYSYFCTSSLGHSVPVIGGKGQMCGERYGAKIIEARGNSFSLDISGAYGLSELTRLERSFEIFDNKIILTDSFDRANEKIIERLVSLIKPEIISGDIKIRNMIIKASSAADIGAVTVKNHGGKDEFVYTIDYEVSSSEFKCEFIFA